MDWSVIWHNFDVVEYSIKRKEDVESVLGAKEETREILLNADENEEEPDKESAEESNMLPATRHGRMLRKPACHPNEQNDLAINDAH